MSKNKIEKTPNDVTKLIPDFYWKFDEKTGVYNDSIILRNKDLKELPEEFNQIKIINGLLDLSENKLTDVSGFNSLQIVGGYLGLWGNQLTDVSGFQKLQKINGSLDLSHNELTNISGFGNLQEVKGNLYLSRNKLSEDDLLKIIKNKKKIKE